MPGTIQVSILELVGLPSLLQSSSMGIRVSVGKQAHEIQEKGELFFPLASLRDNLNVTLHDSEGNEIAHTAVDTRSIVEKGIWDDLFALKGGGHVRMRLHFNLTEHELNRIRSMRETATQKKQEDLLKRSHRSSDLAVASGGSPASSQDSLKGTHHVRERQVNRDDTLVNKNSSVLDTKVPSKAHLSQKKQAFSSSKCALDKLPFYPTVKEVIQPQNQDQSNPSAKKPSSVRKMVLAFESSPVKEAVPASNRTRTTPQLSTSTTMNVPSKAPSIEKTVDVNAKAVSLNLETTQAPSMPEGRQKGTGKMGDTEDPTQKKLGQMTEQFKGTRVQSIDQISKDIVSKLERTRQENKGGTVSPEELQSSGGIKSEQKTEQFKKLRVQSIDQAFSKDTVSETEPATEEGDKNFPNKFRTSSTIKTCKFQWNTLAQAFPSRKMATTQLLSDQKSKLWKSSQHRVKSKKGFGNEHFSNSLRGWTFLDENIYFCIPRDDRPFVDILEGYLCSPDISQGKLADAGFEMSEDGKNSVQSKQSASTSPPNKEPPRRPTGQAIKIAIMVGFGVLVFFTRQRK